MSRAVADFPFVTYLLAFDPENAARALAPTDRATGWAFLEKIVQVAFDLPLPDQPALDRLFTAQLDAIIASADERFFEQERWVRVFRDGIQHFLATPRDVVRLLNALQVTYAAVQNEVNIVDFVALEALRVFCPEGYRAIRGHRDEFVGASRHSQQREQQQSRAFHDAWLGNVVESDRAAARQIVSVLFPRVEGLLMNATIPGDQTAWSRVLRVAAPERFPTFFRLSLAESEASFSEVIELLALANDPAAFGDELRAVATQQGGQRLASLLSRINEHSEDLALGSIQPAIDAVFGVGDDILRTVPHPAVPFDYPNDFRATDLVFGWLARLPQNHRAEALRGGMFAPGASLSLMVFTVGRLGTQHGRIGYSEDLPEEQRVVDGANLADLEQRALAYVREARDNGSLIDQPHLNNILLRWREWSEPEEAKAWLATVTADDARLVQVLAAFATATHIGQGGASRVEIRLSPGGLSEFLDPESVIGRVRALATVEGLSELERAALSAYIREYDGRPAS